MDSSSSRAAEIWGAKTKAAAPQTRPPRMKPAVKPEPPERSALEENGRVRVE